ncbi:hypothetical protein QFC20_000715 [Naganishia adeliensis]|uniref:Uncharacterized protein n=1 Tax=Naganishia adeliensis TaxID=92952 RepID=A0ACC2WXK2_9TREE|nr:hypothetical protein QFC20_000715 [Naganishia adeliensis]
MDSNILRIKRKATEQPLASLVIHESAERAKKRSKQQSGNEDANRDGAGVFRLAQTVTRDWEGIGEEAEAFRTAQQATIDATKEDAPPNNTAVEAQSSATTSTSTQRVFRVYKPLGGRSAGGKKARMGGVGARAKKGGFFADRFESPTPEPAGDFRFIDARPEPASRPQTQPPPAKASEPTADPGVGDASMEVDDDDMKEIAKFLPMLQESTAAPRPKPRAGPIPLAPPAMYNPNGASTPVPPALSTRASSLASTPSRNGVAVEEDDGDYVYDLYYRDPVVSVKDLSEQNSGLSGEGVGALEGLDELLDEDNDPGSDTEEGDEADEDSNDEDFYRNEYPEDEDASSGDERFGADARRAYRYGDELDADRDGFDEEEEEEENTHDGNAPPSIRARQLDRMMRNLGLNKADLEVRQSSFGAYPSMTGGVRYDADNDADDDDEDEEEQIQKWKVLHDD